MKIHSQFMDQTNAYVRNPKVIIQSPTLDALFDRYEDIDTVIEITDMGGKSFADILKYRCR